MYYVKRFLNYVLGLFGPKYEPIEVVEVVETPTEPKKPRKKHTPFYTSSDGKSLSFSESFSELLGNLKLMFEIIQLPTKISWITADERIGFNRLGIYVPHPWEFVLVPKDEDVVVESLDTLPAMMAVAFPFRNTDDAIAPQIHFCLKLSKPPMGVEQLPGHSYKFGSVVNIDGKLLWLVMYIVIDKKTGKVSLCRELRQSEVQVKKRPPRNDRDCSYYNRRWNGNPAMMSVYEDDETKNMDELLHHYKLIFKNVFDWWTQRKDKSWNVSTRLGKRRLVFSLDRMDTKKYFADRDLTIQTETGKRKKIIHFVNEHERTVKDKKVIIKEHLRGLNKFTWNGYDCVVTAPKFSKLNTVVFDIAPEEEEDLAHLVDGNTKLVGMAKVAEILANEEEANLTNEYHPPQRRATGKRFGGNATY
jgi:hypothetical protein